MPTVDWSLDKLVAYQPPLTREPDFDQFWAAAKAELAQTPIVAKLSRVDYPCSNAEVYALRLSSVGGQELTCWYLLPAQHLRSGDRIPALIHYHGYSGHKGRVTEYLHWLMQGYAVVAMDVRGQAGDSPDVSTPVGGQMTGRMTQSILDPASYYYKFVYMDALRVVEWLRTRPEIDPTRVIASGNSQGGGITLAVAALDGKLAAALPDVPFLCHFRRSMEAHTAGPYQEISEYLKRRPEHWEPVFRTLSYFDCMNLAPQINCPVLCSVALLDNVCPPSSVYAAYNQITAPKEIRVYPYNGHEGGAFLQTEAKYTFLRNLLAQ